MMEFLKKHKWVVLGVVVVVFLLLSGTGVVTPLQVFDLSIGGE